MLSNAEDAKEESCCDNTDDFVNYDVNQGLEENQIDREFVSDEEYGDVEYIQEEEEEGSTSLENLVEATENAADDERNDEDV